MPRKPNLPEHPCKCAYFPAESWSIPQSPLVIKHLQLKIKSGAAASSGGSSSGPSRPRTNRKQDSATRDGFVGSASAKRCHCHQEGYAKTKCPPSPPQAQPFRQSQPQPQKKQKPQSSARLTTYCNLRAYLRIYNPQAHACVVHVFHQLVSFISNPSQGTLGQDPKA